MLNFINFLQNLCSVDTTDKIAIVNIEKKNLPSEKRADLNGFDDVLNILKTDEYDFVIMSGFLPASFISKDKRYHACLADPRVIFLRLPFSPEALIKVIEENKKSPRPTDNLAEMWFKVSNDNSLAGILLHKHRGYSESWLEEAQNNFGDLKYDDMLNYLKKIRDARSGQFADQEFPDVCVDIENTLLVGGKINEQVKQTVVSMAAELNAPITVWTGGDVDGLSKKLREQGIEWKIISKEIMKGATVSVIIDDLPQDEFFEEYEISCKKYLQI